MKKVISCREAKIYYKRRMVFFEFLGIFLKILSKTGIILDKKLIW